MKHDDPAGLPASGGAGATRPHRSPLRQGDVTHESEDTPLRRTWAPIVMAARVVLPFALAASAAPVASLWGREPVKVGFLAAAFAVMLAVTVGMVGVLASKGPLWLHDMLVLASIAGLALVVHGAGGAAYGMSVVLLVPVVWMALYGRPTGILTALVVEAVAVVVLSEIDGSGAPRDDARFAIVVIAVSAFTAWTVHRLVHRLDRSQDELRRDRAVLATVAEAARVIREGSDARRTVCEAVLTVSVGTAAVLFEVEETDFLALTASAGIDLPAVRIPLTEPSIAAHAYQTGQSVYVPDTASEPRVSPTLAALTRARSLLAQPFWRDGAVAGVVIVVWPQPRHAPRQHTVHAMALLAQEIGAALERADLRAQLQHEASTDPLTGLANRRIWRSRVPGLLTPGQQVCVALLDLDFFKAYNDTRGHLAGDKLLRGLAKAWAPLLRPTDLLVRWGGEEFAVAMPDCGPADARDVVERLRAAVPDQQRVSAGIACWDHHETLTALMARADAALYQAKTTGRDRTVLADLTLGPSGRA